MGVGIHDLIKPNTVYDPHGVNVLVVDEYPHTRSMVVRTLKNMNFSSVFEASTGDVAKQILKDNIIELVITELDLKNVDGFELIEFIRNRSVSSDIPILVVTGESTREIIVKSIDLGANDFLVKPFPNEDLVKKIDHVLTLYYSPDKRTQTVRNIEKFIICENYDEAFSYTNKALAIYPDNTNLKYLKALILYKQNKLEEALSILEKSIEESPSFYKNYVLISDIQMKTGRVEDGVISIKKELEYNGKQPVRHVQLGFLLIGQGNVDEAKEHFREALKDNPRYPRALEGMFITFMMENNVEKVMYYLKRWRRSEADSTKPLEKLIDYCIAREDVKEALYFLKDERNKSPKDINIYLALTVLYIKTEDLSSALDCINQALDVDPDSIAAQILKINILISSKQITEALTTYNNVVKRVVDSDIYYKLAEQLTQNGVIKESLNLLYKLSAMRYSTLKVYPLFRTCLPKNNEYFKCYYIQKMFARAIVVSEEFEKEITDNKQKILKRRIS